MKKSRILLSASLFLIAFAACPEDFQYDKTDLISLYTSDSSPSSFIYRDGRWMEAKSLLQLFPLMEVLDSLVITSGTDAPIHYNTSMLERWGEWFLTIADSRLALITEEGPVENLHSIEFSGTPMESDALEIWVSWEGVDLLKELLTGFARSKGINLKMLEVPRPESKLLAVARARGDVPDLVMVQSSGMEQLVRERAVQPVGYMQLPSFSDQGVGAFSVDGRLFGVPFYCDTQVFLYNKNLLSLDDHNDWTLGELERKASSLPSGVYPFVWNAYSSSWLIPFQYSFGRDTLIDREGMISVNDVPTAQSIRYLLDLIEKGLLHPMERDAMDTHFINNKAAVIMTGSYSIPYFESLGMNLGILSFPLNESTGRFVRPLLDYKGFVLTRKTSSPLLARRFIQYISGPSFQQTFCPALNKLPSLEGIADAPGLPVSHIPQLVRAADRGVAIPPFRVYGIYKNNMWKLLRFALSKQMSVEETLRQGQVLMENTIRSQK